MARQRLWLATSVTCKPNFTAEQQVAGELLPDLARRPGLQIRVTPRGMVDMRGAQRQPQVF